MAKKNTLGKLLGTGVKAGIGFSLSRGRIDPVTGIEAAPSAGDRFRTAARLTIPAFAAEDRFQTEERQLGISRESLVEQRARTNIQAFDAESEDRLRQAKIGEAEQQRAKDANLDKRLNFDTILPQELKGEATLVPEIKNLLTSMGGVLNKDGEISARTFKELNDTHEERQAFQRGMGGIIGRKLGTLDKSEAILKGTLKNKLDKFNQDNGTNISFEDLANPEIRQTISDSQLLTQSENLQKIQKKKDLFRVARDRVDDVLGTADVPNLGDDFERTAFELGVDPRNQNLYKPENKDIIAQINERVKERSDITLKNEKLRLMGMKTGLILEEDRNVINARIKEIDNILSKGKRGQQQLTVIGERVHDKSGKIIVKLSDGNIVEKLIVNGITIYKDSNGNDITDVVGE